MRSSTHSYPPMLGPGPISHFTDHRLGFPLKMYSTAHRLVQGIDPWSSQKCQPSMDTTDNRAGTNLLKTPPRRAQYPCSVLEQIPTVQAVWIQHLTSAISSLPVRRCSDSRVSSSGPKAHHWDTCCLHTIYHHWHSWPSCGICHYMSSLE